MRDSVSLAAALGAPERWPGPWLYLLRSQTTGDRSLPVEYAKVGRQRPLDVYTRGASTPARRYRSIEELVQDGWQLDPMLAPTDLPVHAGGLPHARCGDPIRCSCCCQICLATRTPDRLASINNLGFLVDSYARLREKGKSI